MASECDSADALTSLCVDCARLITRTPGAWHQATEWLMLLPLCQKIQLVSRVTRKEKKQAIACVERNGRYVEAEHAGYPKDKKGYFTKPVRCKRRPMVKLRVRIEYAVDWKDRLQGVYAPIAERLIQAIHAVQTRWNAFQGDEPRDGATAGFGIELAQRIVLVAALCTIDFDGAALPATDRLPGVEPFPWPWDAEPSPGIFAGRHGALCGVPSFSQRMIQHALRHLQKTRASWSRRGKPPAKGPRVVAPKSPGVPSAPVFLKEAAEWFNMDARTLKGGIENGTWAAQRVSKCKWRFDLEEVTAANPSARPFADPETRTSKYKRNKKAQNQT